MKKQGRVYRTRKTLRAARKRLLAASQGDINDISAVYELELLYDPDTNMKYSCCQIGTDLYYDAEPVYLN